MTVKKDSVELDAYMCIVHAAERGVTLNEYMNKVNVYAHKRLNMVVGKREKNDTNK